MQQPVRKMEQPFSKPPARAKQKLNEHVTKNGQSTYTIKLAGLFVFRVQGKSAEAACERAFRTVSKSSDLGCKTLEVDESFLVTNVIRVDPRRFEKTPKAVVKGDDEIFEILSHVTREHTDPMFLDVRKVEEDAKGLLEHINDVHALKCDEWLHEASTDISSAVQLLRRARVALLRRSEVKAKETIHR